MDHELVKRGLGFARRRRKWIGLLAAFGVSSYAAYRIYHSPAVARKRRRLAKLLGALVSVLEMASDSAETVSLVSKDLKEFLQSDTDEIPRSLRQISKIARSEEFCRSVSRVTEALTVGIVHGYTTKSSVRNGSGVGVQGASLSDKVMDRLFSSAGTGFASVVVGSFAKNLVLGFYSASESVDGLKTNGEGYSSRSSEMPRWLNVASDDKCRELIGDCIQKFVSTAVAVYLDKTLSINTYDEIFAGMTNPKHQNKVQDILVALCNNSIETLIKTSHQVLTTSPDTDTSSPCAIVDRAEDAGAVGDKSLALQVPPEHHSSPSSSPDLPGSGWADLPGSGWADLPGSGWADQVSSALAVPSNRRFVLDVTGRVTFETVRSLLMFLSWKLSEGIKRSLGLVHEEVVVRGLEVARFISAKSSVIVTLCLALYLHVLGGTGVILAA